RHSHRDGQVAAASGSRAHASRWLRHENGRMTRVAEPEVSLRLLRELPLPPAPPTLRARVATAALLRRPAHHRAWGPGALAAMLVAAIVVVTTLAWGLGALRGQTATPSGLAQFHEGGLAFDYPASWREFHYEMDSSFSHLIAYLGTVDVPAPCLTTIDSNST